MIVVTRRHGALNLAHKRVASEQQEVTTVGQSLYHVQTYVNLLPELVAQYQLRLSLHGLPRRPILKQRLSPDLKVMVCLSVENKHGVAVLNFNTELSGPVLVNAFSLVGVIRRNLAYKVAFFNCRLAH
jgi:hypothetical protein